MVTLSNSERSVLGEQVYCDDELGLDWTQCAELPGPVVLGRLNARNEGLLRAFTMLEEHDESQSEDAARADIHRLEGKLDLVLELLSELVRERRDALAPRLIRFNAEGICWSSNEAPGRRALLLTEWFVLPSWPVALKLYVRVVSVETEAAGYRICGRLEGTSDPVRDWLGKLVFRRHRRAIAQQRVTRGVDPAPADTPGADPANP